MNYTSNPLGPPGPNKHDFDELDIIYAHLDSTTTIGASARNSIATEIDHNNPSTWVNCSNRHPVVARRSASWIWAADPKPLPS